MSHVTITLTTTPALAALLSDWMDTASSMMNRRRDERLRCWRASKNAVILSRFENSCITEDSMEDIVRARHARDRILTRILKYEGDDFIFLMAGLQDDVFQNSEYTEHTEYTEHSGGA